MMALRHNQIKAINTTIENNFKSGVHYHVTGSGKSWIAMNIILRFNELNPKSHIIWICEKKSILIEQFNKSNLKSRDFYHIHNIFNILNFSENKLDKWFNYSLKYKPTFSNLPTRNSLFILV